MSLEEVHNYGGQLEHVLRMRVHPIAVKMLKSEDEVPEGSIIPTRDWGYKYALCQSFARSQREGLTVAMFREDMWCVGAAIGLGLVPRIDYFLEGHHGFPESFKDLKASAEWSKNFPCFEYGLYKGILCSSINNCNFMPDVIVMHVNGMQATQLLTIRNWIDGKDVQAKLSGHAACVYAIVPPLLKHDCTVAIPCNGDRELAFAQDDEIIFALPLEMLPEFIAGIDHLRKYGWQLPLKQKFKEEYDLKPKDIELGIKYGLDLRKSHCRHKNLKLKN